jgi:SMI1 / KNR4 family (SUKH-1)
MAISWPPMVRRGPQVTDAQIRAFENAIGRPLPDDYRQFLLDVNGGRLDRANREFDRGVVNRLFSLEDTEDDERDLATCANDERASLPSPDLLYIGHDDGGNSLLLALAGEHRGEVWYMYTDDDARPDDANPRVAWHDRRDMRKVATSFEQFMRSLRPLS